ncbi:MAG: hypothetical protein RR808_03900 [Akkermansia sp.]
MIEFTIFGIIVRVHPWHWIGLAFLGGAFNIKEASDLQLVLLFMGVGFVAILLHELGHALVGRKLGGGAATIDLIALGGYTKSYNTHYKKHGRALSIIAGPAATFLFGILGWLLCLIFFGGNFNLTNDATALFFQSPYYAFYITQQLSFSDTDAIKLYFIGSILWVSLWWTILNLLPIYPMDGGQFMAEYIRSTKTVHLIGFILSLVIGFIALVFFQAFLVVVFMAFFAYSNLKNYKSAIF